MTDTPTIIVSGYLGAGKTTLINTFLRDPQGLHACVLVNDFGAINLDASLIENNDGRTIALSNGCACCTIGGDLLGAAEAAMDHTPDLLIIEASGVAEPARLANLLMGVARLAPARVLTLINAAAARRNAADKFISRLFTSQIAAADGLMVNRGENPGDLDFAAGLIDRYAIQAASVKGLHDMLGAVLVPFPTQLAQHSTGGFESSVVSMPEDMSERDFRDWLDGLPQDVQRIKGHIRLSGEDMWVDQVQGSTSLRPCEPPLDAVRNRVVLITLERLEH